MSTEFVAILSPPGNALSTYDSTQSHAAQPPAIPATFREAMSIREAVFVAEQRCSLEGECDADDRRSWHWVAYASIGAPSSSSSSAGNSPTSTRSTNAFDGHARGTGPSASHGRERDRDRTSRDTPKQRVSSSTASRTPVATIRLVPPPHAAHPSPLPHSADTPAAASAASGNASHEPYVKLGRIATLAPYRRLGLGRLLVDTALTWAAAHGEEIQDPVWHARWRAAHDESAKDAADAGPWRGLVLVHAQKSLERWYGKFGFVRDQTMGVWREEGIEHIGMWYRVAVKEKGRG